MSNMKLRQTQSGSTALIVSLVLAVALLIGALGFAIWAYSGMQDYKKNVEDKITVAETAAKNAEKIKNDKEFAEISKSPIKTYKGPDAYGGIIVKYPKTWSGYVVTDTDSAPFVDGYFNPGVVPGVASDTSTFALRVRVNSDSYSTIMENYKSGVDEGTVKVSPYKLKQVPGVVGSKVTGVIHDEKKGTLIVLPLRANALEIWTESDAFLGDFTKYILPNISFSP